MSSLRDRVQVGEEGSPIAVHRGKLKKGRSLKTTQDSSSAGNFRLSEVPGLEGAKHSWYSLQRGKNGVGRKNIRLILFH